MGIISNLHDNIKARIEEKTSKIKEKREEAAKKRLAAKLKYMNDDELEEFLKKPTEEELAGILEEAELDTQLRILKFLDNKKILKVFSYMSKDDIVDILPDDSVK